MTDASNDETEPDDTSGRHPDGWAAWNQDEGDAPKPGKRPMTSAEQQEAGDETRQP
jgi:hypothetical protein